MKAKILYLCINCADTMQAGLKLTRLPTTDAPTGKAKPCEWCKKLRHGDLYYVKELERK